MRQPKAVHLRLDATSVEVDGNEVIAGSGATTDEARTIGRVLHERRWFDRSNRASAFLERRERWTVALVVTGVDRGGAMAARTLAEPLSRALGDQPVDVVLSNDVAEPLYRSAWENRLRIYEAPDRAILGPPELEAANRRALAELGVRCMVIVDRVGDHFLATLIADERIDRDRLASQLAAIYGAPVEIEVTDKTLEVRGV